ncbi:hypothetical protein COLO4_02970 [Corchorus olitorius]|uniref:Uncharacterized protein n=1 Tax=Corchorus olitorius TaxID=93759 RepID=A0A1R3KZS8_9ROSI|nr:hypothetical protein COLO4_02970 [Corchorus olitorius]
MEGTVMIFPVTLHLYTNCRCRGRDRGKKRRNGLRCPRHPRDTS